MWYYAARCTLCGNSWEILADSGTSASSPQGRFAVKCPKCGNDVKLGNHDLHERKASV